VEVFDPSIQSWILKHYIAGVQVTETTVFDPSIQSWILKQLPVPPYVLGAWRFRPFDPVVDTETGGNSLFGHT